MDFLQNVDSQIIIWAAIGILVVVGIMVVNNRLRRAAVFGMHAAVGVAGIVGMNIAMGGLGLAAVGINVLTLAVAAFLGIPGILMLYGLTFLL